MLKLLLGNPWAIMGVAAGLLISHGLVGYKAYQFASDHQKVVCQKRVDAISAAINRANEQIRKDREIYDRKIAEIVGESDKDQSERLMREALLRNKVKDYEDEINALPDQCVLSPSDVDKLR